MGHVTWPSKNRYDSTYFPRYFETPGFCNNFGGFLSYFLLLSECFAWGCCRICLVACLGRTIVSSVYWCKTSRKPANIHGAFGILGAVSPAQNFFVRVVMPTPVQNMNGTIDIHEFVMFFRTGQHWHVAKHSTNTCKSTEHVCQSMPLAFGSLKYRVETPGMAWQYN